jgi:hypothetical protein
MLPAVAIAYNAFPVLVPRLSAKMEWSYYWLSCDCKAPPQCKRPFDSFIATMADDKIDVANDARIAHRTADLNGRTYR